MWKGSYKGGSCLQGASTVIGVNCRHALTSRMFQDGSRQEKKVSRECLMTFKRILLHSLGTERKQTRNNPHASPPTRTIPGWRDVEPLLVPVLFLDTVHQLRRSWRAISLSRLAKSRERMLGLSSHASFRPLPPCLVSRRPAPSCLSSIPWTTWRTFSSSFNSDCCS